LVAKKDEVVILKFDEQLGSNRLSEAEKSLMDREEPVSAAWRSHFQKRISCQAATRVSFRERRTAAGRGREICTVQRELSNFEVLDISRHLEPTKYFSSLDEAVNHLVGRSLQ